MINQSVHLSEQGIEEFKKMADKGARNASQSLSKLIGTELKVHTVSVRTLRVDELLNIVGSPDDLSISVTMNITGEVRGEIMLVYPHAAALRVADLLSKRQVSSTSVLNGLDASAIKETCNIIAGAFLAAISNYLSINMIEGVPVLIEKKIKDAIRFATENFKGDSLSDEAVAFEIDFQLVANPEGTDDSSINAFFVLLMDLESSNKILASLKNISGGQEMEL